MLQHIQDGIDKLMGDQEAGAPKIKSNEFDIAAFSWCDSHHLISLDRRCDLKPQPGIICRNLLLFPQGSSGGRNGQPLSMSIFLQLADSKYLQVSDLPEASFTLTVVNRVNPENSISKGVIRSYISTDTPRLIVANSHCPP